MWFMQAIYMAFLVALVDCFSGCVGPARLKESKPVYEQPEPHKEKIKPEFHQKIETTIPINHSGNDGELNADIFRPLKMIAPKTLVIMVPGSGNVSRKGEVTGDGINSYEQALDVNLSWATALADHGFFVLSYDKRTCTNRINSLCRANAQKDIDEEGIIALARDLDQTFQFARKKLQSDSVRMVLLSTTQGAQTIALSEGAKKASGVVLLSPIIGDLETMWINGLAHAVKVASPSQKMRLMNQKESMADFFKSLKAGQFPESSIIRGASVKFWQSWIEASNSTLAALKKNNRPALLMFSSQDSFAADMVPATKKQLKPANKIFIKMFTNTDRNFIAKDGVPKEALKEVLAFIDGLPAESS